MTQLVWFITGTSTGIGRELAIAALNRGDKVIATARRRSGSLPQVDSDLKDKRAETLELDVTEPLDRLREVADKAIAFYGRVDILVNNAGYGLCGAIEESTPEETYDQFNTNVFGALNVTRAFLPHMRKRKTGTVVFVGSLGGWRDLPNGGLYAATKWAVRGLSQTLHAEIAPLGLRSICIDLGHFRTSFLNPGNRKTSVTRIPDYAELTENYNASLQEYNGKQLGDPRKGAQAILDLIHEAEQGKPLPTHIQFGSDCYEVAKEHCETALANLEEWKEVSYSTDFSGER
ncbi:hypothetical protein AAF712_006804 [Marasmius tenuissimus]|uniref:NAD(P)-binding protein n=1 Tax=Marasmius tenuissimus TaxID=585030 RepID=A0ABR2ZYP8_9AGAR